MRITAAVYEALKPILNEINQKIEQFDLRLTSLNESLRDDFSGVEKELNSTANMICDKFEEHDHQITTELMTMNQTLTEEITNNRKSINDTAELKCGGTWGWRRVVYLDMTDPNTNSPSGWNMTEYSKRTCGRVSTGYNACDSVFFPVSGGPYNSQVCGRIRAYINGGQTMINSAYVSGVAVMYGSPRQHIWTFANGAWENDTTHYEWNCPCDTNSGIPIPSFIGKNYFCESGYLWPGY